MNYINDPTDNDVASIEYWPRCSYCHHVLQYVDFIKNLPPIDGSKELMVLSTKIEPFQCPICHKRFESIKIATAFPFDGYK
ncbi:MAG: hypothetical protein LIR46_02915 [Bacteroidota bacterium]|nr:hypothetical protein [Bacteroidota bacterium]